MKNDVPARRQLDEGTIVYADPNGFAVLQRLGPGVLLMTAIGGYCARSG